MANSSIYTIRLATTQDAGELRRIEKDASAKFRSIPELADLASDTFPLPLFKPETLSEWIDRGRVWVADDSSNKPVGFLAAYPMDTTIYVNDVSVDLNHNGKGIGGMLLKAVFEWAREQAVKDSGPARVSLTTYADVPWNGPWYAKSGFKEVDPETMGPKHVAKMDLDKNSRGLDRPGFRRCCMLWEDRPEA